MIYIQKIYHCKHFGLDFLLTNINNNWHISKCSSRPTTILAVIVGRRPNTITSNLSEVKMNICIIVYLFMSFVGHIEVKESPSKISKLINCIFCYSSVYFLRQNDGFAYNTSSGSFSGLALQNNKREQHFDPAFWKINQKVVNFSSAPYTWGYRLTEKLTMTTLNLNQVIS